MHRGFAAVHLNFLTNLTTLPTNYPISDIIIYNNLSFMMKIFWGFNGLLMGSIVSIPVHKLIAMFWYSPEYKRLILVVCFTIIPLISLITHLKFLKKMRE